MSWRFEGTRLGCCQRSTDYCIKTTASTSRLATGGTWHSFDDLNPNLKMKYRPDTPNNQKWFQGNVKRYMDYVHDTVI